MHGGKVLSTLALGNAGPLAESPAEEAGVLAGERLLEISKPWDGHVSYLLLAVCSIDTGAPLAGRAEP